MIDLPDPRSVPRVADWVELSVAISRERLSKAQTETAIENTAGTEPDESFISDVWRELEYRRALYSNPTFRVEERSVEPDLGVEPSPAYLACLTLSLFGVQGVTRDPGKLFERVTCKAIENYLSARALVFGWPLEPEPPQGEQEAQLKRKIRAVASRLNERFVEAPPTQFKDRGLDVVGWIPFHDMRSGQIVLLVQCTAQRNWKDKLPVPIENWCEYIHWSCNPIKGFAVPSIIRERDWHERSKEKGILFDRARILNLLSSDSFDPVLTEELTTWVTDQLVEFEI